MKKIILKMVKRILIYGLILIFGLPFGAIAFGANKASASEKKVVTPITKTKEVATKKEATKLVSPKTKVLPKNKTNLPNKKIVSNKLPKKVKVGETENTNTNVTPSVVQASFPNNSRTVTPSIGREGVSTSNNIAHNTPSTPSVTQNPTPEPSASPTPSPSSSNSATTTGGWSKILVALSILIIAAGAALGGYYGYEWLMLRANKDKEDQEPPKSNSRW